MSAVPVNTLATPLAYALAYAKLGWKVLPLEPATKRPHRLAPRGVRSATSDPAEISEIWKQAPDAGIGVACLESGIVVVDIDPRNGGLLTLERLESQYGTITSDVQAITPGGGLHFVFSADGIDRLPGTLGPGIDIKSNGYVCVEPSIHPNGKQYNWEASSCPLEGSTPSPLPSLFADYGARHLGQQAHSGKESFVRITEQTWTDIYSALRKIPSDERETWIKVGMALRSTGETDRAFQLWDEWSQQSTKYDARDQLRVWRSFRSRGLDGITYKTIFGMAQPDQQPQEEPPADGLILTVGQLAEKAGSLTWAVKHALPESSVGMLFGASGTFKSFIAIDYALHRSYGMQWMGRKTKKGRAVYLAAEGGSGLFRRIQAWHLARNMNWQECPMAFCIVPLTLRTQASTLRDAITSACPDATDVIIDTLSQTYTGNENAADEMADYFRCIGSSLRNDLGAGSMILHHSGHSATERPRGSSAIAANIDYLLGTFREEKDSKATLCFLKQKDGELIDDQTFILKGVELGKDEDGDPITSLYARHDHDDLETVSTMLENDRKGGERKLEILRSLAADMKETEKLRQEFYQAAYGKDSKVAQNAKRMAFNRSLKALQECGFLWEDTAFSVIRMGKKNA